MRVDFHTKQVDTSILSNFSEDNSQNLTKERVWLLKIGYEYLFSEDTLDMIIDFGN